MSNDAIEAANEIDDAVIACATEMQAAYVLGRNPHLLGGWLESIGAIARDGDERPWDWEYPDTLFGGSFGTWPEDSFAELDHALRTLVLTNEIDAAVLTELRRRLDEVTRDCESLAVFAAANLRGEASAMHRQGLENNSWVIRFAECLLANPPERLRDVRQLGSYIGKLIADLAHCRDESNLPKLRSAASLAVELFSPAAPPVDILGNLVSAGVPSPFGQWSACKQLLSSLEELDSWILEQTSLTPPFAKPYIVLNDRQRTHTFLKLRFHSLSLRTPTPWGAWKSCGF